MAAPEKPARRRRAAEVDIGMSGQLSRTLDMSRWVAAGLLAMVRRQTDPRLALLPGRHAALAGLALLTLLVAYAWAFSRLTEVHTRRVRASLPALARWPLGAVTALTILLALVPSALAEAARAEAPPLQAPTDWPLTFAATFDRLDLSRWATTYPNGARHLGGSGEQQQYVDPSYTGGTRHPLGLDPFSVAGGVLDITADRAPPSLIPLLQGQHYTSGLLTTAHSFSQRYGYFEMRAKFPAGAGLWPAFWMGAVGSWPPEIDIVECLGNQPTTAYVTVHFRRPDGRPASTGFSPTVADMTTAFHRYGVLWSEQFVSWYFDGGRVAFTPTPADLHQPMYLLVNLAVGGHWPGPPLPTTSFPAHMQVDYVRAYAQPD